MSTAKVEFTQVTKLKPEALGKPGSRTFRLLVDSGSSSAILWMEKEQVLQLALASKQVSASLPNFDHNMSSMGPLDREAPAFTKLDFAVIKLVLGHDQDTGLFIIDAHQLDDDNDNPSIRIWVNKSLMNEFSEESLGVVAAGRPPCALCGAPLDASGHKCPRTNGHITSDRL